MERATVEERRRAPLHTPTDLGRNTVIKLGLVITVVLADVFALFMNTTNLHGHMSGPKDYELLLNDHATRLLAVADPLAERLRKIGGTTRDAFSKLTELFDDNTQLIQSLREAHDLAADLNHVATASLLET